MPRASSPLLVCLVLASVSSRWMTALTGKSGMGMELMGVANWTNDSIVAFPSPVLPLHGS